MAEGITTRLQKEVTQLQKEMEKLDSKMEVKLEKMGERLGEKLNMDLQNGLQQGMANLAAELRGIIKQLLPPVEGDNTAKQKSEVVDVHSTGNTTPSAVGSVGPSIFQEQQGTVPVIQQSRLTSSILDSSKINVRRSKLECPRFEGYDFLGWYMKVEQFFEAVGTLEEEKVQIVMIHLDGKALQWHQRYMKTKGSLKEVKWSVYAQDMRARFSEGEFIDPMSELVSLKQANTVEEYYEEFEALLNLLNLSDEYSLSIFISNLKQDISRSVRLFQPKTLTHALNLAKQMELLIYDLPRKTFTPYKSTVNQPPSYSSNTLQPKSQISIKPHQLPDILPTPKPSFTSYSNYTKPAYSTNQKSTYTKPESVSSKPIRSPTFEEREERSLYVVQSKIYKGSHLFKISTLSIVNRGP